VPATVVTTPSASARRNQRAFPCAGCGAVQTFRPGSAELHCAFCGHATPIPDAADGVIRELPMREALQALASTPRPGVEPPSERTSRCPGCAAEFTFDPLEHAGECPFCATPIVVDAVAHDEPARLHPRSLLPFQLDEREAADAFRRWLGKLLFRPSRLERFARLDGTLHGVYLPYWTYDARTQSSYTGERGTVYYVQVPVTVKRGGRRVTRMQRQARVRWRRVSGTVARVFDDVLIGASTSVPRRIADALAPWDMSALVPYDERYLSGFRSEVYQVGLDQGFRRACAVMEGVIRRDVARDIGGDRQRIHSLDTRHFDITFKHLLLPVWSASFEYRGKRFQFVINGQTGEVSGERPWSWLKIALAAVAGALVLGALAWAAQSTGVLGQITWHIG
jgi:hypothetical protein